MLELVPTRSDVLNELHDFEQGQRRSMRNTCRTSAAPRLALRCARARVASASAVNVERPCGALHDLLGDHHFLDTFEARQVEHGVEQDALHDRAQSARPGLAVDRLAGNGAERL